MIPPLTRGVKRGLGGGWGLGDGGKGPERPAYTRGPQRYNRRGPQARASFGLRFSAVRPHCTAGGGPRPLTMAEASRETVRASRETVRASRETVRVSRDGWLRDYKALNTQGSSGPYLAGGLRLPAGPGLLARHGPGPRWLLLHRVPLTVTHPAGSAVLPVVVLPLAVPCVAVAVAFDAGRVRLGPEDLQGQRGKGGFRVGPEHMHACRGGMHAEEARQSSVSPRCHTSGSSLRGTGAPSSLPRTLPDAVSLARAPPRALPPCQWRKGHRCGQSQAGRPLRKFVHDPHSPSWRGCVPAAGRRTILCSTQLPFSQLLT